MTPAEDVATLYEAMLAGRDKVHPSVSSTGRLGHEYYNTLGYVPYNVGINENAARTLEYAYDDWCIAQTAKMLGKDEDAKRLEKASQNYKNMFDPETRLMRGRNEDGTFQSPFSPYKWGDAFTEGNSWHYTWSVFHDVDGLASLMGGREAFATMLDSVFVVPPIYDDSYYGFRIHEITEMQVADMGNYAHGNQPAQHMIYLYNYAGQPWKAQYWTREVMDRLYSSKPDGYCGDEDNGQTSAWYVFSALGFYPVCPGADEYAVGSPVFRKAVIHLENGNTIEIDAPENSSENRYVGKMAIDGKVSERPFLSYSTLLEGAKVRFEMEPENLCCLHGLRLCIVCSMLSAAALHNLTRRTHRRICRSRCRGGRDLCRHGRRQTPDTALGDGARGMRNLAAGSDDNRRMALLPRRAVDSPLGREQTAPQPLQRNVRLSAEAG